MNIVTKELAQKVLDVVDQGLSKWLGVPVPGQMCVEAAVCYAMGMPHGDNPVCVNDAVRRYKIRLNDSNWSSTTARAAGMRRVAVAQLGSEHINSKAFAKEVTIQVIRQILPIALRAAATSASAGRSVALELAATVCETVTNLITAKEAALQAKTVAAATTAAGAAGAAYATATAAAYAYTAAATTAAYAAYTADAAAYVAYTAAYAADTADAGQQVRDSVLGKAAEIGVQALIKRGSQGAKWLELCGPYTGE